MSKLDPIRYDSRGQLLAADDTETPLDQVSPNNEFSQDPIGPMTTQRMQDQSANNEVANINTNIMQSANTTHGFPDQFSSLANTRTSFSKDPFITQ